MFTVKKSKWVGISLVITASLVVLITWLALSGKLAPSKDSNSTKPIALNQIQDQIKFYEERISINADSALDLNSLATLYIARAKQTGDNSGYDKALELAQKSLKILPEFNVGAEILLAKIDQAKHEFVKAIERLEKLESAEAAPLLITSYLAIGELPKAAIKAEQLVMSQPFSGHYFLRALVYEAMGRDLEADFDFKNALNLDETDEGVESAWQKSLYARFEMRKGKVKQARQHLEQALTIVPNYHLALDYMGQLEVLEKNYTKAESYFHRAFESSKQVAYLADYGRVKKMQNQQKIAQDYFNQAESLIRSELSEGGFGHRLELAKILLERSRAGDAEEALQLAQKDLEVRKGADGYYVAAWSLYKTAKHEQALQYLQKALISGVQNAEYYELMSLILSALNDANSAGFYHELARQTNVLRGDLPNSF